MNTKYMSQKQEEKIAREVKGRTQIASGALPLAKADVRSDNLLIEAKTTSKDYYVLSYTTWEKIRREAYRDSLREPVMSIDLLDGKQRLAIVDYRVWYGYAKWLPDSHLVDEDWGVADRTKKIIYVDENTSMVLVFPNKITLSGATPMKDIHLLITPWNVFRLYLEKEGII